MWVKSCLEDAFVAGGEVVADWAMDFIKETVLEHVFGADFCMKNAKNLESDGEETRQERGQNAQKKICPQRARAPGRPRSDALKTPTRQARRGRVSPASPLGREETK